MKPIIFLALLIAPTIAVAGDPSKVTLKTRPFLEELRPAAEISGAWIVGFGIVGQKKPGERTAEVSAAIPKDWAGADACLKVTSIDGLYESENTYAIDADWAGGWAPLSYPSKRLSVVRQYVPDRLSLILLKGDCDVDSRDAALVRWGKTDGMAERVYLNTNRAEETYLTFSNAPDIEDVVCRAVDDATRTAFDTVCDVPAAVLPGDVAAVSIITFKNGEMGRALEATLHFVPSS